MKNISKFVLLVLIIIPLLHACKQEKDISGNWGFCQHNLKNEVSYNEVYINDSTFSFYIDWFGFLPPLIYKTDKDSIYLFDLNYKLEKKGIVKILSSDSISIILTSVETKDAFKYDLKRLNDSITYQSNTENIDKFYKWINDVFLPDFNKRKKQHKCY